MANIKRIEKDSLGEVLVEKDKLWGAQTQRSFENFKIGNEKMPLEIIKAIALIKKCCAIANFEMHKLDKSFCNAIVAASNKILRGEMNKHFPLSVWQTGSGTQTNMNVNEVIAHLSNKNIHPNDHVNMSQSSNDVFPTAMHIAFSLLINQKLLPSIDLLIASFKNLKNDSKGIIKIGRTHLQDATPLTVEQEISAWESALICSKDMLSTSLKHLKKIAIGGTAVGTGLNAPRGFDKVVTKHINKETKMDFYPSENKFYSLSFKDAILYVHGTIETLAMSLFKIANDVRWLASGPRCGIGELILPSNEPGSSIMPGKINPTQCESMMMVCSQIIGHHACIAFCASQGNFQLNTMMPIMAFNFINSINLLADVIDSFRKKCVEGIKINRTKIALNLNNSLMLVTALTPKIGYAKAAEIAKYAYENEISLKESCLKLNYVSNEEFDEIVKPQKMV